MAGPWLTNLAIEVTGERVGLEQERQRILHDLARYSQQLAFQAGSIALPTEAIQALLRAQWAGLVSYVRLADGRFQALVPRPDRPCQAVKLGAITDTQLRDILIHSGVDQDGRRRDLHCFELHPDRRPLGVSNRLYGELWQPLEQAGVLAGLEHVYVVPDGWLRALPFAALRGPGPAGQRQYLVERYALSVLLGGAFLPHVEAAGQRCRPASGSPALVVDPTHDPVLREIVADLLARLARPPLRRPMTRQQFIAAVNDGAGGFLLFGHGEVGGLTFQDGLLTPAEVLAQLDARGAALPVACLLGLDHALHGLAGTSMISALHLAGCPAVLGALWRVPARASAELLLQLEALGNGPEPTEWARALQQAQCALLARPETADPYYWAGFSLYGLPRLAEAHPPVRPR